MISWRGMLVLAVGLAAGVYACAWTPVLAPLTSPVARADEAVGKALIASGRKALAKRKYDEAVSLFEKAMIEAPEMIEAAYWLGATHEKADRNKDALAAYRRFEELCADAEKADALDRSSASLRKKTEKRIDSLAAGERELDRLREAFVKKLLLFVRKHAKSDKAMAAAALRRIVSVDPRNEEARRLADDLEVELDEAPPEPVRPAAASVFDKIGVERWYNLITKQVYSSDSITYERGLMKVDTKGGMVVECKDDFGFGQQLLYEMDVRVTHEHEREWSIGLVLGWGNGNFLNLLLKKSEVLLSRGHMERGPLEDIQYHPMPPVVLNTYRRLGVRQQGKKIDVFLDGKRLFEAEVSDTEALTGDIALFQQRCKADFRLMRVGEIAEEKK